MPNLIYTMDGRGFNRIVDIRGQVFDRLTVIDLFDCGKGRGAIWLCRCSCGNHTKVGTQPLKKGATRSCGCLASELNRIRNYKPNSPRNNGLKAERDAWRNMQYRCYNPKFKGYKNYGGRGIVVCDRWVGDDGFDNFLADMGPRPAPEYSLDRYPNNSTGNYEPTNCRWGTKKEQSNNTRENKIVVYKGQTKTLSEWKAELGFCYETVTQRLKRGYSVEEAFETPAGQLKVERRGYVFTDHHRRRLINRLKKPILQLSKDGVLIKEFPSTKDAEIETGINSKRINDSTCGRKKFAGGYIWRHKN